MSFEPHHTEFEHWLRQQTDGQRLYPDESVWDRVHNRVQKRRWYPLVLALLLITGGAVSWVMIDQPDLPINYLAPVQIADRSTNVSTGSTHPTKSIVQNRAIPFKPIDAQPANEAFPFIGLNTPAELNEAVVSDANESSSDPIAETPKIAVASEALSAYAQSLKKPVPEIQKEIRIERVSNAPVVEFNSTSELLVSAQKPQEPLHTIESIVSAYRGKRTRRSWQLQLTVSPTVSYRKLIENRNALQSARSITNPAPLIAAPELNSVVNHKPDMGLQFGLSVNRRLSDRLAFTGGLQFNINKYNIRAYQGAGEVATVGLNSGGGTGTFSSYTPYRSSGGYWANWLDNFNFSASLPIGFQYQLIGNKKWRWGIASTLQPTYVLGNQAYILSTDYKNYLEVPSLTRRWNLNGQVETFVGFQTGKTRWTLGPQARYQILSSYENVYPVEEHLFDIGIKLGVGL